MIIPLYFIEMPILEKKLIIIGMFFIYTFIFLIFNRNRDLGMVIGKTYWKENYSFWRQFVYNILYTASFATLLFSIIFPFDLFLANMLLFQLPTVLMTGTTFHGFLAGKMTTIIK